MTDVSLTVLSLLMAVGLLLIGFKRAPLSTGKGFIVAGVAILCAHSIDLKIMAPVTEAIADQVD